jgi:ribose transport system substrate-binding protein
LQGLYACNAPTSVGALQALRSQKRTEVKMVGFDAEKALAEGLRAGEIEALVVQNPFKMGYEGVKAVVAQIKGQPGPKRIDTGVEVITKANLDEPRIKDLIKLQ